MSPPPLKGLQSRCYRLHTSQHIALYTSTTHFQLPIMTKKLSLAAHLQDQPSKLPGQQEWSSQLSAPIAPLCTQSDPALSNNV
jgi:hypothetical protein